MLSKNISSHWEVFTKVSILKEDIKLLNPNLDGLFRGLFWIVLRGLFFFWGGVKITPCLKLIRIMLETSNLAGNNTFICSLWKYAFYYQGLLNFADFNIFLQKVSVFGKNSTFTQSSSVRAVLKIFCSVFSFCKIKGYY